MRTIEEQHFALECLKMAARIVETNDVEATVQTAQRYFDFVLGALNPLTSPSPPSCGE